MGQGVEGRKMSTPQSDGCFSPDENPRAWEGELSGRVWGESERKPLTGDWPGVSLCGDLCLLLCCWITFFRQKSFQVTWTLKAGTPPP